MTRAKLRKLIVVAREAEILKRSLTDTLFRYLESSIEEPLSNITNISAENANNLEEAITCHIDYGECDIEDLLDDIMISLGILPDKR